MAGMSFGENGRSRGTLAGHVGTRLERDGFGAFKAARPMGGTDAGRVRAVRRAPHAPAGGGPRRPGGGAGRGPRGGLRAGPADRRRGPTAAAGPRAGRPLPPPPAGPGGGAEGGGP